MGANSCRKGKAGELELKTKLRELLGDELVGERRWREQFAGAGEYDLDVGRFAVEVKRDAKQARGAYVNAWNEACQECMTLPGDRVPAAALRQNKDEWRFVVARRGKHWRDCTYADTIEVGIEMFADLVRMQ